MQTTFRLLIAAATLAGTATFTDAQGRARTEPPANAGARTALTEAQRTQLRELREQQLAERRALAAKHREAMETIDPEQARRLNAWRDQRRAGPQQARPRGPQMIQQRRGPQMGPPQGRGPYPGFVPPGQLRRQGPPAFDPRDDMRPRGRPMQPGRMVVPPQLGRGPVGPIIQGRPLPPARGSELRRPGDHRQRDAVRRPPPPPPRDRR